MREPQRPRERSDRECECKAQSTSESKVFVIFFFFVFLFFCFFFLEKIHTKLTLMVQKMMKFGANVAQTALKGLNLAQTGNYNHVLNLKYTCRALPSCFFLNI